MIYAVDFDGTLVENIFPKIGKIKKSVFDYVVNRKAKGDTIILWTCREGERLSEAVSFCKENGLIFDYVNDNAAAMIKTYKSNSRKIVADFYIDDRNIMLSELNAEQRGGIYEMKETRCCEIRATNPAGAGSLIINGVPIVYDTPTVIELPAGSYTEIIRSGALDGADISDARLLYNHSLDKVPLARTPKTMQLNKSAAGLEMVAELPDTQEARAVYTAVQRGDLSGMSFSFKVPKGGDRWNMETRTREILKIEKIYEISIVPFPAYPHTSVEARAVLQDIDERKDAIIKCNQLLFKGVF